MSETRNVIINIEENIENPRMALVDSGQNNSVYSKTQIDSKPSEIYTKVISSEESSTSQNISNLLFRDTENEFGFATSYNWGDAPYFNNYSVNLSVKSRDVFFNLSIDPLGLNPSLTAGSVEYNKGDSSKGWNKKLAFTENNVAISAPNFINTSLREYKKNIKDYKENALSIINSLKIVEFDRVDTGEKNVVGVIAEETPINLLNTDKTGVDLYKTIFLLARAIQELDKNSRNE